MLIKYLLTLFQFSDFLSILLQLVKCGRGNPFLLWKYPLFVISHLKMCKCIINAPITTELCTSSHIFLFFFHNSTVDIAGYSNVQSTETYLNMSQIDALSMSINPVFGMHSGDPSSDSCNESLQSDDDTRLVKYIVTHCSTYRFRQHAFRHNLMNIFFLPINVCKLQSSLLNLFCILCEYFHLLFSNGETMMLDVHYSIYFHSQ